MIVVKLLVPDAHPEPPQPLRDQACADIESVLIPPSTVHIAQTQTFERCGVRLDTLDRIEGKPARKDVFPQLSGVPVERQIEIERRRAARRIRCRVTEHLHRLIFALWTFRFLLELRHKSRDVEVDLLERPLYRGERYRMCVAKV